MRIHLNGLRQSTVGHTAIGLWRHPDSQAHRYRDLAYWVETARILERGRFDALFVADALGPLDVYQGSVDAALRDGIQTPTDDPLLPISAMAAATEHLGFAVTVSSTYELPYAFARRMTTLDHLTGGRIGWNIVTSALDRSGDAGRQSGCSPLEPACSLHLRKATLRWPSSRLRSGAGVEEPVRGTAARAGDHTGGRRADDRRVDRGHRGARVGSQVERDRPGHVRRRERGAAAGVGGGVAGPPGRRDRDTRCEDVQHGAVVGPRGLGVGAARGTDGQRLGDPRRRGVRRVHTGVAGRDRVGDSRRAGHQEFVALAPLLLIWVADLGRARRIAERAAAPLDATDYLETTIIGFVDTALGAQNAVLAARSLGLGSVFVGAIRNHPAEVAAELELPPHTTAAFGLAVGEPDPAENAAVKPRLPQAAVLHHEQYDAAAADRHIDVYDERLAAYNGRFGLSGDWNTRVLERLRGPGSMAGRHRLRETLHRLGLPSR